MPPQDDRPGFEIQGRFYPLITLDDYLNRSWDIVRRMIYPRPTEDYFLNKIDGMLYTNIMAAVAVEQARDDLDVDKTIEFIGNLKFNEITLIGMQVVEVDDADSPPEIASPGDSSESTEPSSEPTPE